MIVQTLPVCPPLQCQSPVADHEEDGGCGGEGCAKNPPFIHLIPPDRPTARPQCRIQPPARRGAALSALLLFDHIFWVNRRWDGTMEDQQRSAVFGSQCDSARVRSRKHFIRFEHFITLQADFGYKRHLMHLIFFPSS